MPVSAPPVSIRRRAPPRVSPGWLAAVVSVLIVVFVMIEERLAFVVVAFPFVFASSRVGMEASCARPR